MNQNLRYVSGLLLWLVLAITVSAQSNTCPAIVDEALSALDMACQEAGRNQACYGNVSLQAMPKPDVTQFQFGQVGDLADLSDIEAMRLSPLNEETGEWGVALMQLQADIPDALPGQNVTFLLFGNVELVNASTDEQNPMQAFFIATGIGAAPCEEAPQDGLLVQTPTGVQQVSFNINGVDVAVGSTVFFQVAPNDEMRVTTLEGTASFDIEEKVFPILAGTQARLPIDEDLLPLGTPSLPEAYNVDNVRSLPIQRLQRVIDVVPPLDDATLSILRQRLADGLLPCDTGDDDTELPDCDELSLSADALERIANAREWLAPLSDEYRDSLQSTRLRLIELRQRLPDGALRQRFDELDDVLDELGELDELDDFRERFPNLRDGLRDGLDDLDDGLDTLDDALGSFEDVAPLPPPDGYLADGTPCVLRPLEGDPPYPPNETRPYCPDPTPPPPPPANSGAVNDDSSTDDRSGDRNDDSGADDRSDDRSDDDDDDDD
jgi:hypothetical protein